MFFSILSAIFCDIDENLKFAEIFAFILAKWLQRYDNVYVKLAYILGVPFMQNVSALICADMDRERMCQGHPNCLSEVLFRPMLCWVLSALDGAGVPDRCIISCTGTEGLEGCAEGCAVLAQPDADTHPVFAAMDWIAEKKAADIVVLCAEAPFVDAESIRGAYELHTKLNHALTVLASGDRSTMIREQNVSAFFVKADFLMDFYKKTGPEKQATGTLVSELSGFADFMHASVGSYEAHRKELNLRAENYLDLLRLTDVARARILQKLCGAGVEVVCADGVMIEPGVKIGAGTKILAGTILQGNTVIGEGCVIGPNSWIVDGTVGNGCVINASQIRQSRLCDNVHIGPFTQVRPDCVIHDGVKIGDFVEVKNSEIGARTSVAHLTYVGDSDVGEGVNFGCGVVTVNYDGKNKHRTKIGDNAFIGCNTNMVAPVTVGSWAFTAAGTTVTEDVPDYSLAIGRARQENKLNWVAEHDKLKKR